MTDETTPPTSETAPSSSDAWQEVGRQFQALGVSLAAVFQAAWKNEEVRQQAEEMKTGLESLVKEVGQAIHTSANSPEAQRMKTEATKAAESFRAAGEETVQEVRPHLVSALQTVNEELQTLIGRLGSAPAPETPPEQPPAPPAS